MYYHIYKSEIGKIYLVSKGHALCGCYLESQKNFPKEILNYQKDDSLKIFIEATNWLERYFKGENVENNEISLEVNGTDFRRNVWNIIKGVPYANTVTYKQIADTIIKNNKLKSMSYQAVGSAVGYNPLLIFIPCHRVIRSDGDIKGYSAGNEIKKFLLNLECDNNKILL